MIQNDFKELVPPKISQLMKTEACLKILDRHMAGIKRPRIFFLLFKKKFDFDNHLKELYYSAQFISTYNWKHPRSPSCLMLNLKL